MATKRMLIDAQHTEETRVVVTDGKQIDNFDIEVASRQHIKGNIYLAKVMRVEPSLQAAFVDFGGNRHGFLTFSEIHPDYFQIPIADREALLAAHRESERRAAEQSAQEQDSDIHEADDEATVDSAEDDHDGHDVGSDTDMDADADDAQDNPSVQAIDNVGGDMGDDSMESMPRPSSLANLHHRYKIQEVIRRGQILLVQAVKEERGTKGAAMTSYISLPGRYCVLMPNTARGWGISRKISNAPDRRRLHSILSELDVPDGMAIIVRTAGSRRTKPEIRRDYDYLIRLWSNVREKTLESTAPSLINQEGNIIHRAIRDIYDRDIEEVLVEGDDAYREARDFMKLLIPSHAKRVKHYKEQGVPLFHHYGVEAQLDKIHSADVSLPAGGYLVISQTEALVAIDVNSGRATGERNVEETALTTNMEAAEEIARQLRLRDMGGLVVIDFIDMEVRHNRMKVERLLKESMRTDRARIQIGRISPFGLLELSRQRLRASLIETNSSPCPHCGGSGAIRSIDSAALSVLRTIEDEGMAKKNDILRVYAASNVVLYILNQKRALLQHMESRYDMSVILLIDESLNPPQCRIEHGEEPSPDSETKERGRPTGNKSHGRNNKERDTKERRSRGRKPRNAGNPTNDEIAPATTETASEARDASNDAATGQEDNNPQSGQKSTRNRSRRGKRGGRQRTPQQRPVQGASADMTDADTADAPIVASVIATVDNNEPDVEPKPAGRTRNKTRTPRKRAASDSQDAPVDTAIAATDTPVSEPTPQAIQAAKTQVIVVGKTSQEAYPSPIATDDAASKAGSGSSN